MRERDLERELYEQREREREVRELQRKTAEQS